MIVQFGLHRLTFSRSVDACNYLLSQVERIAASHSDVKCVWIHSEECIDSYPDKNLPTLLVYKRGDLFKQFIQMTTKGLSSFFTQTFNIQDVAGFLQKHHVLPAISARDSLTMDEGTNFESDSD